MTINEIISIVDTIRPNKLPIQMKIEWLNQIDGMIYEEIVKTHDDEDDIVFTGYDEETDTLTELIVPNPYAYKIYVYWMCAQADLVAGENGKYTNDLTVFQDAYDDYAAFYNRNHMPKQTKVTYY